MLRLCELLRAGEEAASEWINAKTAAWGLRVPKAVADFLILKAMRESGGTAVTVSEKEIADASRELAQKEGMFVAPEAAAGLAGIRQLLKSDLVGGEENVILINTGRGNKYLTAIIARPEFIMGEHILNGRLAQLGERLVRNEEVASSNLVPSIEELNSMPYMGGSAFAMARDVGEGYILVNHTTLKRMTGEELKQLRFEIERLLTGLRSEQPSLSDMSALQTRNRKLSRLNSAVSMINNQMQSHTIVICNLGLFKRRRDIIVE